MKNNNKTKEPTYSPCVSGLWQTGRGYSDFRLGKRVIIVDDSRTIQAMLTNALETVGGLNVIGTARDARTAAAMIAELRPDVVTIDLCMPYIDGTSLLEMLRDFDDICKIVISDQAAANIGMVTKLRSLGAAACISKSEFASDKMSFMRKIQKAIACSSKAPTVVLPCASTEHGRHRARRMPRSSTFGVPVPADEQARLSYLSRKKLANATRERQFDLITQHTAQLTGFPVSLMTFIDQDTQWIKSSFGYAETSMPRAQAFCAYTIAQDEAFVVRNAANDDLFASNSLVTGDPGVRTYVGHPIITVEGIHAGALCVIDTRVRTVSDGLLTRLKGMAAITAEMLNMRPLLAA